MNIKRFFVSALLLYSIAIQAGEILEKGYPLKDAVECQARGGLPNFFAKLKTGKKVKIGYFGGSITAQKGWRVESLNYFRQQFPQAEILEINAALGGTGSVLGVFRLKKDLLRHKPDLIFVEFAVNDLKTSPDIILNAMEGIVRQTWKTLPDCDICFIYTVTVYDIKTLQAGKTRRSSSVMEKIADHYNIPSINLGVRVSELIKKGLLVMRAQNVEMTTVSGDELNEHSTIPKNKDGKIPFSKDGVHPYLNTGHKIYMDAIISSLPSIKKAGCPNRHKLPAPLSAMNCEDAKAYPLSKVKLNGFVKLNENSKILTKYRTRISEIWKGTPGASLKFKFKGTKVGIYDIMGPDCGYLKITVDGEEYKIKRFDGYSKYHRLSILNVSDKLLDKVHTVEIKVLNDKLDKKKILLKRNQDDFLKYPSKYEGNNWYIGAIFIVGSLVEN